MKKVLLFLILINLSLLAQSNEYINELYYAIKYNNAKGISNAVEYLSWYDLNLNNILNVNNISEGVLVGGDMESWHTDASPLIYAIYFGNIEAIDTLLKLGANVKQLTDISGRDFNFSITPLMYAAACSPSEKVVSFLISKGANVNTKDKKGRTALMYSAGGISEDGIVLLAEDGYADSSKILINAGADVNAKDYEGRTALMYSAYNGFKGDVDLLIKNKANVNAKDKKGKTALMYACMDMAYLYDENGNVSLGNLATVKSLIRAGANINEVNDNLLAMIEDLEGMGNSALLYAIRAYTFEGIDNLSDGAIGIYETIEEYEASSRAAYGLELIKLLINNGANVNIRNKEGETPLSLSKEFPKLTKLLRDSGAYLQ